MTAIRAALLAVVLLAACSAAGTSAEPSLEPAGPVTITFGGDVHAEPPIDGVLARGDNPLADLARTLRAADLAVVNVETAVGTTGTPADKSYTFQAPPSLWPALVEAGVDVVTLANNHALDFGRDALVETIEGARAAGLAVVGAGQTAEEAYAPALVEVGGRTVAVVGLTRVMPVIEWAAGAERVGLASAYDVDAAARAVRDAAARAERVAVVVHWGKELAPCPVEHQVELAAALLAAGADVIAGHHAHRLQGVVTGDGTVVAYGLGNLVFYASSDVARTTALLTVTLDDGGARDPVLTPARIDAEGSPRLLQGAAAEAVRAEVAGLAPGAGTCPAS